MGGYPCSNGVEYIFSIQVPCNQPVTIPPAIGSRSDVSIFIHRDTGITRNRNHAISHASAPYILMADDDLHYTPEALQRVISEYESRADADYILWQADMPDKRTYPPETVGLTGWLRNYHPVSIEFSFRRQALDTAGIRWNELAGIGAPYLICGEEELMFRDLLRSTLRGYYINHTVTVHAKETTSGRLSSSAPFLRTKGAIMRACRGAWQALLRLPVEAHRSEAPFLKSLAWLLQGYAYGCRHNAEL